MLFSNGSGGGTDRIGGLINTPSAGTGRGDRSKDNGSNTSMQQST